MTRETRLNLIFLSLFLALTLPGAVILFIKKLDPSAPKMFEPDAVETRVPYMTTASVPAATKFVVPPMTEAWVQGLTRERAAGARPLPSGTPVMSDDRRYQAVAIGQTPAGQAVYVIAWDADAVAALASTTAASAGATGRVGASIEVPVPDPIRQELKNYGLNHGSPRVGWLVIELTAPPDPQADSTKLLLHNGKTGDSAFVNLFTR